MAPNNQHYVTCGSRCSVCKDIFATKEVMREHYSETHIENNTISEDKLLVTSAKKSIKENEEQLILKNKEFIKENILGGSAEYERKGRYDCGSYICKICNRELTYKYSLEKHILLHTFSFPYRCHLCSKRFNGKAILDIHITIHNGGKPFSNHIYQQPFNQCSNLQRHQLTYSQNRDLVCKTCGKHFNHMASLKAHTLIHIGDKPFLCHICMKRFTQKGNLKRHIQTHRNGKQNKVSEKKLDETKLDVMLNISLNDSKEYHQENEIRQGYLEGVEDDMPKIASDEKKRVKTKRRSSDYEYNFHNNDNDQLPTMINDKDVTLSYNDMITADGINLHNNKEKDDDTILTPSDIINVMNAMNNESNLSMKDSKSPMIKKGTFHCDVCGKQFTQKANLWKHKLIHMDKKPYQCKVCQKAFRQKANLQRHEVIHNKARKAVDCNNCRV